MGAANPLPGRFGATFFSSIPDEPGVYLLRSRRGELLYVGKAKRLRARLRSYTRLVEGRDPAHLVELVGQVRSIRWIACRSEAEALRVEAELLRSLRPPYNSVGTEPEQYLFLSLRFGVERRVRFELGRRPSPDPRSVTFGCFAPRKPTRQGYAALLRLLYTAEARGERFHYPGRLRDERPPYRYDLTVPDEWVRPLKAFLRGRSLELLRLVAVRLVENEAVPGFLRHSLQRDLDTARRFFRRGPKATRGLRRGAGRRGPVSPEEHDGLVRRALAARFPDADLLRETEDVR